MTWHAYHIITSGSLRFGSSQYWDPWFYHMFKQQKHRFTIIQTIKEDIRRAHVRSIINLKCYYISNIKLRTNNLFIISTYTITNLHTNSIFNKLIKFIYTASIPKTNFICNFLFNYLTITNPNFGININVYLPPMSLKI